MFQVGDKSTQKSYELKIKIPVQYKFGVFTVNY